jgi:hypothetical protein
MQYELCYTTMLNMIDLAGIPLRREERGEDGPVLLAGGPCSYNPEPVADFIDVFSIGEGEEALPEFARLYLEMKENGTYTRNAFLRKAAADIEGVYIPAFYEVEYNEDGTLKDVEFEGRKYKGCRYMQILDERIREARFNPPEGQTKAEAASVMWYLWLAADSPLFGKDKMTTFERYFIEDKTTHKEHTVPYYKLIEDVKTADIILEDFDLNPKVGRILNGHVPVKLKDGETPIKAGGKLFIIDGGISKAYQKTTGIAGYTAILTSKHMYLAEHKPYEPLREDGTQVFHRPVMHLVDTVPERILIRETDNGQEILGQIRDLEALYKEFNSGGIKEIN